MRKLLSVVALTILLAPGLAMSGAAGNAPASPLDRLAEVLSLTDAQKSEIEAILTTQNEKYRTLQTETQQQINDVLTEEQRAKLDELQRQREEQLRQRLQEMQKQQQQQQQQQPQQEGSAPTP